VALSWTDPTPATTNGYLLGLPGVSQGYANAGDAKNEIGYRVERALVTNGTATAGAKVGAYSVVGNTLANVTAFNDAAAELLTVPGAAYNYRVTGWNTAGGVPSTVTTVAGALPALPTGLSAVYTPAATRGGAISVAVTWVNNATNASGYAVERAAVTVNTATGVSTIGAYALLAAGTLPATATSLVDTTVKANTLYLYRVTAKNGTYGNGVISNTVFTGTLGVPLALQLLGANATGNSVGLTWQAPASMTDITGYDVLRCVGTAATCTVTSTNWVVANVANIPPGKAGSKVSFTDTGLVAKTSYVYRVRSHVGGLNVYSAYSNTIATKTK
jgi:hypothetical protein